ncbi:putative quinol monooxygenase [Streptomyces sp. NPDC060194]|uniref:putative quinol monooxygenase n=1 Tax=Streptomyces sp. NPDC060194 TaxID=3347069 RepID=UPI00365DDFD3
MSDTVMIIAESTAAQGKAEEVVRLIEDVVEPTRAEAGCVRYELMRDLDDDHRIILIEEWADQSARDAHLASEHLVRMFREMEPLLAAQGRGTRVARIA